MKIEGAQRPFWMHQLVEYLIGMVLIAAAFQSPKPAAQSVLGLAIIINAAITKGGAGAFKLIGRRTHRIIDVVLMVLLVVGAVQRWVDVDATGRILLPAIAVVMLFVWLNTDFSTPDDRRKRRTARARPESEEIGRKAGRAVGDGVNQVRRWRDKR